MEKLCLFCKKFNWEGVTDHYGSAETGGWLEGGAGCKAGHFYSERPEDNEELRALFLRAETCRDYEPPNVEVTGRHAKKVE